VTVYQDTVWFSNPHPYSHHGPQPIDQLMQKLGAEQVAVDAEDCYSAPSYPDTVLLCDISFVMKDEKRAQELYDQFQIEFDLQREIALGEWVEDVRAQTLIGLPFEWAAVEWKFKNPNLRLFQVERSGEQLRLVDLCLLSDYGKASALQIIVEYLQKEECTNISYSFKSERLVPRKYDEE
jgi:hypothetical protein